MKTTLEGKGIYAGNWTFALSTVGGGLGGTISVFNWIFEYSKHGVFGVEELVRLVAWGIGGTSIGAGAGAAIALVIGSTAARSFYPVFACALGMLLTLLPVIVLANIGAITSRANWELYQSYLTEVQAVALVGAIIVGSWLAKDCVGFSIRAQRRARYGLAIAFLAAFAVGLWIIMTVPAVARQTAAELGMELVLMSGVCGIAGAMFGAMCGPDRDSVRGFSVLESMPCDDATVGGDVRVE